MKEKEITCFDCENNQGKFCPLADMYLSLRPRFCDRFQPCRPRIVISIATVVKAHRIKRKRLKSEHGFKHRVKI